MIGNDHGSCIEVEDRHFMDQCQWEATAMFTKGAALSWKTASLPVASEKRESHFCALRC